MDCRGTEEEIKEALYVLGLDPSKYEGNGQVPKLYLNHYFCACGETWDDSWISSRASSCPKCKKACSPISSNELDTYFNLIKKRLDKHLT